MKQISTIKQQGFSILAIILLIVVITVAIGIWSMSGESNSNSISTNPKDIQVNGMLNDAYSIKSQFDRLVINGADPKKIIFMPNQSSSESIQNILDPQNGIDLPKPTSSILRNPIALPEGIWVYNATGFKGLRVGSAASDPVLLLAGITDVACQRINNTLYGTPKATNPKMLGMSNSLQWVADATAANPNTSVAMDLNTKGWLFGGSGWLSGCIASAVSGAVDQNIFFHILQVN